MIRLLTCALAALMLLATPTAAQNAPAEANVEALIAADRAVSAAAARAANGIAGLEPMFDAEVTLPLGGNILVGRDAVLGAFRANPAFLEGRVEWTPARAGISADGMHGFTYGYLTLS